MMPTEDPKFYELMDRIAEAVAGSELPVYEVMRAMFEQTVNVMYTSMMNADDAEEEARGLGAYMMFYAGGAHGALFNKARFDEYKENPVFKC